MSKLSKELGIDVTKIAKDFLKKTKKVKTAKALFYTLDGCERKTIIPLPAREIFRLPLTTFQTFTYAGPEMTAYTLTPERYREYALQKVTFRKQGKKQVATYVYREQLK